MGQICAENIAGQEEADYRMIPRAVFPIPRLPLATLKLRLKNGFDVKVGRFNFIANGKRGLAQARVLPK